MNNMQYYMPTKIVMGDDCIAKNAGLFTSFGKKALIVTGAHSAKANGSLDDVIGALTANGQQYAIYDKVMSNPTIACVYEGAAYAREQGADFIIAIGGGSPMDAGKAIALLTRQDIPEEELFSGNYGSDVLPMAYVPTTAGTGSEVTQYAVLTNDRAQTKTSLSPVSLFPKLALLDAKYMDALSGRVTINTAIDALSHSVEGMLSSRASVVTDILASKSIEDIASCFSALKEQSLTHEQCQKLLLASTLGGMVIANTGTTAVHAMGYSLTYFRGIDHGRANGLLLASFLEMLSSRIAERVDLILSLMGVASIDELRILLGELLEEKETISEEEMRKFTGYAMNTRNIGNCMVVLTADELLDIYKSSF